MFSGVFRAEELYGVGDMVSGDTTKADVQTLLGVFLNTSLRCDYFTDEALSGKKY
jgi:hypothetical protein